ncbi:MAG: GntR family transcriptional regulator [Hyphomicrobiaceae bacterium]
MSKKLGVGTGTSTPAGRGSISVIAQAFMQAKANRLPKIAQLYNAMVDVIGSGQLESGAKLPGERELSHALGISLGTAQKSLALLMRDGQIVREHGRGSFVGPGRRPLHELWHYRFRASGEGDLLPVYAHLCNRSVTYEEGPWVAALGSDEAGYVEITRLVDVDGRFTCWSTMRLRASRFRRLLDLPRSAIEDVNLKLLLLQQFDAPTIGVRQTVRVAPISQQVATLIKVRRGSPGLILNITALSRWNDPISHQEIVVPQTKYAMELGAEPDAGAFPRSSDLTGGRGKGRSR